MSWSRVREFLNTQLFELGGTSVTVSTVLVAALVFLAAFLISYLIRRGLRRGLRRKANQGTMGAIDRLTHYVILIIGFSIGLQTIGLDLTALFAAGAIFAVGLGFAMKNIAENFVSGVILLIERSIRPGDVIDVDGRPMRVSRMGIRSTIVQTRDGEDIIMPNSNLVQSQVRNFTLTEAIYRARFQVGVVYSSDMRLVKETLSEAARNACEKTEALASDRKAEVLMVEFGNNSVVFEVAIWLTDPWRIRLLKSDIAEAIWWALKDKGIVIAFPQLDVHFDEPITEGFKALGGRAA